MKKREVSFSKSQIETIVKNCVKVKDPGELITERELTSMLAWLKKRLIDAVVAQMVIDGKLGMKMIDDEPVFENLKPPRQGQ